MDFVYALINFLLLAGLIWLLGRRAIGGIFSTRRARINRELDEAQALEAAPDAAPALPAQEMQEAQEESAPSPELLEAQTRLAGDIRGMEEQTELECRNLRRAMVSDARSDTVLALTERVRSMLASEPYCGRMQRRQRELAAQILAQISLTPGDMAYLRAKNVLYVTLTAAYPLEQAVVDEINAKTAELLEPCHGKTSFWYRIDPELIGGFQLRIGDTIYGCSVDDELYNLQHTLLSLPLSGHEDADALLASLSGSIGSMPIAVREFQRGRVISVSDGICWMDGLSDIMYGEVVEFECGERGMVLDIQPDRIGCVIYGRYEHIESGSKVRRVGRIASVPVGEELLGRVVDPLGHPIDGGGRIWATKRRPIEFGSPAIPERASVNRPLHTGIKAVDALVPIGRGQRELIIGDRQTGKSSIAVDAIIHQRGKRTYCIYVAIGQKDTTVAEIREKLLRYGAMEYTTIVSAPASSSASFQYIAPFAGAAMGEYFMYDGRDVLIVYDDLSKHAVAYRELSLLLHRPSGREAYPGDVFYLHARLLERAAQLSAEAGGGSMTALPIIETQAGDISSYIPTNVISITDGQIFLESELFNEGQRPAINVGLSVSRVGSAAQTKLMKQCSGKLRLSLAQYRELSAFSQFDSDLDESTKRTLAAGARMMAALRQGRYTPLSDWQQAALLFAVAEGGADRWEPGEMEDFETALFAYLEEHETTLVRALDSGKKMDADTEARLRAAIAALPGVNDDGQSA